MKPNSSKNKKAYLNERQAISEERNSFNNKGGKNSLENANDTIESLSNN